MARAIEKIERDIATLEEATRAIAQEFHTTYERYLNALGQAMQQQSILASYHLCTQGYPEAFLSLSFNQRQQLQQAIRELGQSDREQLKSLLTLPPAGFLQYFTTDSSNLEELVKRLVNPQAENALTPADEGCDEQEEPESPKVLEMPIAPSLPNLLSITKPDELAAWQERVEGAIVRILQKASRDTNRLLQQHGILPKKLPEPVLEAAAKVEASAETMPGPPNLLNLVIETETERESQGSSVMHLIAIHLRLSEIEFAAPSVASARQQIRTLSAKLANLRRDYQKKQRERSVAEAEAAWRASWFDE